MNLAQDTMMNAEILNKGFILLDNMFKENGWHLTKNEMDFINYTKAGDETAYFEIQLNKKEVFVCVPLKNSSYQYFTSFKSYFEASEYIEKMFNVFIGSE
jgi:hypothetical protein